MFEKLGRKIDNGIQWIKERFYLSPIYTIYARYGTKRYIKQGAFHSKNHLANYLEYTIKRGWFSAEEAVKLLGKWEEEE